MRTYLQLGFMDRNCNAAFAFYETVFEAKRLQTVTWRDAPPEMQCPEGDEDLILHTGIELGSMTLMGADAHPGRAKPFGGFVISLDDSDEDQVKRLFATLSAGGSVIMPLGSTFWSPLFGRCRDRFGVDWMISVPGPQA